MRFQSKSQQSLKQLQNLSELYHKKSARSRREDLFLLSASACQGLPMFPEIYSENIQKYDQVSVRASMRGLALQWKAIHEFRGFRDNLSNRELRTEMYALDETYFELGKKHPHKLLVVFTTMYNNFYISNLSLISMLRELGVSILLLKDSSVFYYMHGRKGMSDIAEIVTKIRKLQLENGIRQVYISGFSSSGYASLYISTLLACDGYLGFSIRSDLSGQSERPSGKFFTDAIRETIDQKWLIDLKELILSRDDPVPRKIFYGTESKLDKIHARHLSGVKGVSVVAIKGWGHNTPGRLLMDKRLKEEFRRLIY